MGVPRWVWVVAGLLAFIWLTNDPAGMGQFFNNLGESVVTVAKNLD